MATLTKRRLAQAAGFSLDDVRCACGRSSWSEPEQTSGDTIVFVRRGCFRRRADGIESVLDATTAYVERPGQVQQVAHPGDDGDVCTQLALPAEFVDDGAELRPRFTSPQLDLAQRLLLAAARDNVAFVDHAVALADGLRSARVRRRSSRAHRALVEDAREALAQDPTLGLVELARLRAVSPHHLSRTFRAVTGETVSRYRNRLRVRLALERFADGEERLARLAAELGFADQAHLSRVVRQELDRTPSALRKDLQAAQ